MQIPDNILREYDVRGIAGKELTPEIAYALGKGFALYCLEKQVTEVAVGKDVRLTSDEYSEKVIKGLRDFGVSVVDFGITQSPGLYWRMVHFGLKGGVVVTASHNPGDYNGFKFRLLSPEKEVIYVGGDEIKKIGALAEMNNISSSREGKLSYNDGSAEMVTDLFKNYSNQGRSLKIVWDLSNGAVGQIIAKFITGMPQHEHILMFSEMDGKFPGHSPDPSEAENLEPLSHKVREEGADIGICFDGDGDRFAAVDDEGIKIDSHILAVLLAKSLDDKNRQGGLILDVKAPLAAMKMASDAGIKMTLGRIGVVNIIDSMKKNEAVLGAEISGHTIFMKPLWYGFDDALFAALQVVQMVQTFSSKLSDWQKSLPPVFVSPETRFACADDKKFAVVDKIAELLREDGVAFSNIDGVRVDDNLGWWGVRASNTQPLLSARCEGKDEASFKLVKKTMGSYIERAGVTPPDIFK